LDASRPFAQQCITHRSEFVHADEQERLERLHLQNFRLQQVDRGSIHLDDTGSLLNEGDSSRGFLCKQYTGSDKVKSHESCKKTTTVHEQPSRRRKGFTRLAFLSQLHATNLPAKGLDAFYLSLAHDSAYAGGLSLSLAAVHTSTNRGPQQDPKNAALLKAY
jgi:hypothetical protein